MNTTYHRPSADDLRAYGLPGAELARASERREAERQRDQLAATIGTTSGPLDGVRRAIGEAMIRIGAGIAGEAAKAPRVTPVATPKIDMA